MKLLLPIVLAALMGLLASCHGDKKDYTIAFSQCSSDEWRQKMNLEMTHEAALRGGVELQIKSADDNSAQQIADIQDFIDQKVDLIIVSPNEAAPITPIIEKVYQSGIPVVLVDRKILSDQYTAFIGADNYLIGKEVGAYVNNILNGSGNVLEITGLWGSTPAMERHYGFISITKHLPNLKVVAQEDARWFADSAYQIAKRQLAANREVDLVFAHNDRMALAAYNAANELGLSEKIQFVGIDAMPNAGGGIELVIDGKINATFIYPTGGDKIMQLAFDILENKPYEKNNPLYTGIVNQTNARTLKLQTDEINEQRAKIEFFNNKIDLFVSQYTLQRYLLYSAIAIVVLAIGMSVVLYLAYRSKIRLNLELAQKNIAISNQKELLEQQRDQLIELSKKLEEATHAKLMFFTNVSHEFRTPLTLIAGPVNTLIDDHRINLEQRRLLQLAQRNVEVLLKLVDQIIDFRKYESGKLTLTLVHDDLRKYLSRWNESFAEIAKKKKISFSFHVDALTSSDGFGMDFDVEKMESIYFNLISNALKFTPEKGRIDITLSKTEKEGDAYALVEVENTGMGISSKDISRVFDSFFQADNQMTGSGIGLALVKAFVELHGGSVGVISRKDGTTIFSFSVPMVLERAGNLPDECPSDDVSINSTLESATLTDGGDIYTDTVDTTKPTLLVVDDNPDICAYVKSVLQHKYVVLEAADGEEGFAKAVKYVPDVVVSDVMMPKIDGVELCHRLKSELSTSHIPVVLLTACSHDEQRIAGFESGADDYVSKPFNVSLLEVRIRKLIENRQKLKELYMESAYSGEHKEQFNEIDKAFIGKLRDKIEQNLSDSEQNLSDSDLNVEDLGKSIGLSRSQLYRKLKATTNYSPNEFLRVIRLKKAMSLLSSSQLNVSEVAYEVGFSTPSYFTKCFKEYFDESPTDYQRRVQGTNSTLID